MLTFNPIVHGTQDDSWLFDMEYNSIHARRQEDVHGLGLVLTITTEVRVHPGWLAIDTEAGTLEPSRHERAVLDTLRGNHRPDD